MKPSSLLKPVFLIAGASLLATGCVVREVRYRNPPPPAVVVQPGPGSGEVVVGDGPPEPIIETVPVAPDPAYFWIGGYWGWRGRWVWEPGHFERRPHPGAIWVPHRYVVRGGRHVWVRGYWR